MDHGSASATVFHRLADMYRDKYMDLTMYDDFYRAFCALLPPGRARVLDAACGPGNVSRFLLARRPELDVLGIDLAPRMIELARAAVPAARFAVQDCRQLGDLQPGFDGIICAFGLPYLSTQESADFIRAAARALVPGGVLYLSTMLGRGEDSGFARCSTGDRIYLNYHGEDWVVNTLQGAGLTPLLHRRVASPSAAAKASVDLILIARRPSAAGDGM